ncbi:MAG TPA: sigma-70 family RNA polymerase sigma factor [Candidatus Acidoferrum sp.]
MISVQQTTPRGPENLHGGLANAAANDERLLVAEAKSGSSSAFAELYERHRLKIYHITLRILRNQQDAEDAAQRSFQRAFTNLPRFRGDSKFSTWVNRIAINEALMMLRGRRTSTPLFESDGDNDQESLAFDLADKRPTPEEALAENELRAIIFHAISQLRENLRTVVLRQLQGLTSAQTARHLGLSVAAVKARTFHARRHLRRQLERKLPSARNGFLIETRNKDMARR